MNEEATSWAVAGDQVIFNLSGVDASNIRLVWCGMVTCMIDVCVHGLGCAALHTGFLLGGGGGGV